jgi:hypothetical protein
MVLDEQTVNTYKMILNNPVKYGLNMKPFKEYFSENDKVIAQHELAASFIDTINPNVPKLILYIMFADQFGPAFLEDSKGNLGYKLKLNN